MAIEPMPPGPLLGLTPKRIPAQESRQPAPRSEYLPPRHFSYRHRRFMPLNAWVPGVADQPTIAQLEGAGAVSRIGLGMGHLNNGRALLIEFAKQFHDFLGLGGMQVAGRLIGQ